MSGQGFEFTPFGVVPLGTSQSVAVGDTMSPATANVERPAPAPPVAVRTLSAEISAAAGNNAHLRPRDVIKAARQRIREIKAELRRLSKLERELKQLQRLVDAANGKTLAPVRAIDSARRAV